MKQKPKINNVTTLGQSRLFHIEQLSLQFSNGAEATFERIRARAGKAVMVVALTEQQEILLVSEYAAGTEQYELQCPKGIIEPGEDSLAAANRELAEETGYAAKQCKLLQTMRVSPGYFDHQTDLVLATDLYPHTLDSADEPEPPEVIRWSLDRIDELLARQDFSESRSIAAVLLASRALT